MSNLNIGAKVLITTTKLKKGHVRKNGEVVPDKVVTTVRSGEVFNVYDGKVSVKLRYPQTGYTRLEVFHNNEVTAEGTNPLFLEDK